MSVFDPRYSVTVTMSVLVPKPYSRYYPLDNDRYEQQKNTNGENSYSYSAALISL